MKRVSLWSWILRVSIGACATAGAAWAFGEAGSLSAPIDRIENLTADGARLYLTTRGAHVDAPLLLWLHGGPGGAESPLFRYFNGDLEDRFIVAYWDQRGAGRSFDPAADLRKLTIARHLADLDLVVDHLRRSFAREKIVLIGHSWGATLALLYASVDPQKIAAVIAVTPSVATTDQQKAEFEFVSKEAQRRQDVEALSQLRALGPPPYSTAAQTLSVERLSGRYGAVFHHEPNRIWVMIDGILRGLVVPWEIPDFIHANEVSLEAMREELQTLDLRKSVPRLETPVVFFLGRHDRHVDASVAAGYFDELHAPAKQLVWFENSAHNPPFEEADLFDARVVDALASLGLYSAAR